jgi:hypothetical protein
MTENDYHKPHYVYLIGNKGLGFYKIGIAMNVEKRTASLSLPFPVEVYVKIIRADRGEALFMEGRLHDLYNPDHLRGEWFRDIDIVNFVCDVEYIDGGRSDLARKSYLKRRGIGDKQQSLEIGIDSEEKDRRVLLILKEDGLEAAQQARKALA